MSRGIYLVANKVSEAHCANLIHTIRSSGCTLPIRLIPFGGVPIDSPAVLAQVEVTPVASYSSDAVAFVEELAAVLTACPRGFLYRFLAWFGDWDDFIYSDNDIVALMDWSELFAYLDEGQTSVVHADQEYVTNGCFNIDDPAAFTTAFGPTALAAAITAGHFAARKRDGQLADLRRALAWMTTHPGVTKRHDQALLHLAVLLGGWQVRNLCKPPDNWASSWSGDYATPMALVQTLNGAVRRRLSHLHYSGGWPDGSKPIEVLLHTDCSAPRWNRLVLIESARQVFGYNYLRRRLKNLRHKIKLRFKV
jgi:hypothetical protein